MYNDWFRTHLVEGDVWKPGLKGSLYFNDGMLVAGSYDSGEKCKQFLIDGMFCEFTTTTIT